jgi:hypothetical protein
MRFMRIAMLLLLVALIGPSAAGAFASGGASGEYRFRTVSAAPAEINVSGIEFSLQKGDNASPVNPSNRFAFGTRRVWAFWAWDDAKNGDKVNYVLRQGGTDIAWGTIGSDGKSGRMEVELERLDGDYLGLGIYRLYLDASGGTSGAVRSAEFEIYDTDDNGNSNNNGNSNSNNNNDNHDGNNNNNNDNFDGNNNNNNDNFFDDGDGNNNNGNDNNNNDNN